ncbi:MAG: hypothetical protein QF886_01295, partial [Planctomycetota bacterium]|nr:hypothetical protein [Planctomycetota bacterium]
VHGHDDFVLVGFDHPHPPFERFLGDRARWIAALLAAPDRRAPVVSITHQEEENIAGLERIAIPFTHNGERAFPNIYARVFGILAKR